MGQPGPHFDNGIANRTGCTCYIASTIQLLFHCIPEFRYAVINVLGALENDSSSSKCSGLEFLRQLSRLFRSLQRNHEGNKVDATAFYETLVDWNGEPLDLNHQGDAASMLSLLLSRVSTITQPEGEYADSDLFAALREKLKDLEGSTVQTITGILVDTDETKQKIKVQKPRTFRGPWPLSVHGQKSIVEALTASTVEPQLVERYNWESRDENGGTWVTQRTIQFHSLPRRFILHLTRCDYLASNSEEGEVIKYLEEVGVPHTLDLGPFMMESQPDDRDVCESTYFLHGVIVHAGRRANDGHYLTLINASTRNNVADQDKPHHWVMFDDEHVSTIDISDLPSVINGGHSAQLYEDDDELPQCAMVLLYSQSSCRTDEIDALRSENNIESFTEMTHEQEIICCVHQAAKTVNDDTEVKDLTDDARSVLRSAFNRVNDHNCSIFASSNNVEHLFFVMFRTLIPKHEWDLVVDFCRVLPIIGAECDVPLPVILSAAVAQVHVQDLLTDLVEDAAAQRCVERFLASCFQTVKPSADGNDTNTLEEALSLLTRFVDGVLALLTSSSGYNSKKGTSSIDLGCRIVENGMSAIDIILTVADDEKLKEKAQSLVKGIFQLFLHPGMGCSFETESVSVTILKLVAHAFAVQTRCFPESLSSKNELFSSDLVVERITVLLSQSSTKRATMKAVSSMEQVVAGSAHGFWITRHILEIAKTSVDDSFLLERAGMDFKAKGHTLKVAQKALLALADIQDVCRWERIELLSSCVPKELVSEMDSSAYDRLLIFFWRLAKRYWLGVPIRNITILENSVQEVLSHATSMKVLEDADDSSALEDLVRWHACPAPTKRRLVVRRLEQYLSLADKSKAGSHEGVMGIDPCALPADYDSDDDPEDLLSCRIAVRWANGKFYPGQVASYDDETGKHRIRYDDGDERDYKLLKKTWDFLAKPK